MFWIAAALLAAPVIAFLTIPGARFAVANAPTYLKDMAVSRDIVFDAATGLRLDVYAPAEAASTPRPVVVFFYGGGWRSGDKANYRFMGATLAERGYVVVIPDYRKLPSARFPDFVEDGAAAVSWTVARIAAHGGDPERVFLAGHSAGAHLGAMLAVDERYLAAHDLKPSDLRGFAGLAGPYHFTPKEPDYREIFGPPARYPRMQASRFVDGTEPPMLLMYGLDDAVVGLSNLERMTEALDAAGGRYEAIRYQGVDHIAIISAFTWAFRARRPMVDDMVGFFRRVEDERRAARQG